MNNRLTIRSYSKQSNSHSHRYHQLVLPIQGSIEISIQENTLTLYDGIISVGDCVVIKAGSVHRFSADNQAKFIVADLNHLPSNIDECSLSHFAISSSLQSFIQYIGVQLESQIDKDVEQLSLQLFLQLLQQQEFTHRTDPRIEKVIQLIQYDLSQSYSIAQFADTAYLSATQFKKLFKQSTGLSCMQYITKLRMEKAKALLIHTDTPIQIVAEQVGYNDLSAFSRRFSIFFNQAPSAFRKAK